MAGGDPGFGPAWYQELVKAKAGELDNWAVAEVAVSEASEAISLVERAIAVLRVVQHIESPMSDTRHQTFGLPGQAGSARIDYIRLDPGPAIGWQHWGALARWNFSDQSYENWMTDPAYRYVHEALSQHDADRTSLQRRSLISIDLLSQAWSSWQPDISLLNHAMAVEALLGEPRDQEKKVRIARRASYFVCGRPGSDPAKIISDAPRLPIMPGFTAQCSLTSSTYTMIAMKSCTPGSLSFPRRRKDRRHGSSQVGSCSQCLHGSRGILNAISANSTQKLPHCRLCGHYIPKGLSCYYRPAGSECPCRTSA